MCCYGEALRARGRLTRLTHPKGPPHPEIARRSQARGGAARGSSGARWQWRRLRRRRRRRRHGALRARRRVQLLNCGRANDGMRRCGARACGLLAVAGRAQRVVTRGCAVDARIRQQAAVRVASAPARVSTSSGSSSSSPFCSSRAARTRCRSAPASARSAPARQRRERRLEARSTHRRPLLAPASGRGKRVMVQWIGRRREQGASCGCTPASCSPRLASFGEGEESCRLFCVDARVASAADRTAPPGGQRGGGANCRGSTLC